MNDKTATPSPREALDQCMKQFAFYAAEHAKAGKHEKAATNQRFADLCHAALSTPPARPGREEIARVIDPMPFHHHAALVDYCRHCGDSDADAQKVADATHGPDIEKALTKASQILALFDGAGA